MQATVKRRQRWPQPVEEAIDRLIDAGLSAKEIEVRLARDEALADFSKPGLRAIQDRVKRRRDDDAAQAQWWEFTPDMEREDARAVFDALADVVTATEGRRSSFTTEEARHIAQLKRLRPSLDGWVAYRLARLLIADDMEAWNAAKAWLAYFPQQSDRQWVRYAHAVLTGAVPMPPSAVFATVGSAVLRHSLRTTMALESVVSRADEALEDVDRSDEGFIINRGAEAAARVLASYHEMRAEDPEGVDSALWSRLFASGSPERIDVADVVLASNLEGWHHEWERAREERERAPGVNHGP